MTITRNDFPDWYVKLEKNTPPGEEPNYISAMIEEFCGRFDLTKGKALSEIRRCKLWQCSELSYASNSAKNKGIFYGGSHKVPIAIPLPEFDRYASIIEAEKKVESHSSHPILYLNKRHPAYTSELEAAVSCWMALFADAQPGTVTLHNKEKAIKWMETNRPKLDKSQQARIATVLTPDSKKKGGCTPSSL